MSTRIRPGVLQVGAAMTEIRCNPDDDFDVAFAVRAAYDAGVSEANWSEWTATFILPKRAPVVWGGTFARSSDGKTIEITTRPATR